MASEAITTTACWDHSEHVQLLILWRFVPDNLRPAVVQPQRKKATLDPDYLSWYGPILNPNFLSKVIEREAAARLSRHIESQQLLPSCQSAYKTHHSTQTAIIAVQDEIARSVDSGDIYALVLPDLSAAFDMLDHDTLLHVFNHCFGITDGALQWCKTYLCQRTQSFCVNGQESDPYVVDCSVPQGSVLRPLKLIRYTEDLAELINHHQLSHHQLSYHFHADDTQLTVSTPVDNAQSVVDRLQRCAVDIHQWCASRHLQLKPSKTELIYWVSCQPWEDLC